MERKQVIAELLPVMDNVLRLKAAVDNKDFNTKEGMKIILKELEKIFTGFKIKKMECVGEPFSPQFHEAVLKEKTDEYEDGTVLKIVNNGYYLGEEVIKPATVIIADNPMKEEIVAP